MWTWVTRSSPLKGRTITDFVFMQTYSNHGALQPFKRGRGGTVAARLEWISGSLRCQCNP